jgi:arginase
MKNINKNIRVIGIPMDLGQMHRGVSMGPGALRYSGLSLALGKLGYFVEDIGDLNVPIRDTLSDNRRIKFKKIIKSVCELAYTEGEKAINEGFIPIFLGGDHSISMGTVGGVSVKDKIGLIWIDAHGDFNTFETTITGNIHGMSLAALLGYGDKKLTNIGRVGPKLHSEDVVLIGLRKVDYDEQLLIKSSGITVYTMKDIDERGMSYIAYEIAKKFSLYERIHVSLDLDCLDPVVAPGVGTPVPGGITYREGHLLMEIISNTKKAMSMDIVEVNPMLDMKNITAVIAVELAVSLFGKSIL